MTDIERGDVLLVNLESALVAEHRGKSRPCLVVSLVALNEVFRGVMVCPITDAGRLHHSELGLTFLPAGEGALDQDSLVIAFQLRIVDKRRIIRKLGRIEESFLSEVNESLRAILDIP